MLNLPLSMLHIVLPINNATHIINSIGIAALDCYILKISNVFAQSSYTIISKLRINALVPGFRLQLMIYGLGKLFVVLNHDFIGLSWSKWTFAQLFDGVDCYQFTALMQF